MKRDRRLTTWLKNLMDKTIDLSAISEPLYSKSSEKEGERMDSEDFNYTTDEIAEIYSKLEVARILTKMGTEMAREAADQIKFIKITRGLEDDRSDS